MKTVEQRPTSKLTHVSRLGFGGLVLFAMIGNCTGRHDAAVGSLAITVMIWAATKITIEAIESYTQLFAKKQEPASEETKQAEDKPEE